MSKYVSGRRMRWTGLVASLVVGLAVATDPGAATAADAPADADAAKTASSFVPEPGSPEEVLFKRADAFWSAVVTNGDIASFFPVNKRGRRWIDRKGLGASEYQIQNVWVDGDRGYVRLSTTMRPTTRLQHRLKELPEDMTERILESSRTERWQLKDGEWYRKRSRRGLSRLMNNGGAPEPAAQTGEAAPERQPEQNDDQTEGNG